MRFFSFNRNHAAVMLTLLFLLCLGAIYFFMYLPQNEKRLQEQRFRTLQNVDKNIHAKIENSIGLMNNLLSGAVDTNYIHYLSNHSKENLTLTPPPSVGQGAVVVKDVNDSNYTVSINAQNRQVVLVLNKQKIDTKGDTLANYQMAMKFSLEQFISSLLPKNVFDHYVVFSNADVVYETLPAGINYLKDSLLDKKTGLMVAGVKSMNISGKEYRIFLHPVSFVPGNELTIAGMLSSKRYQIEKNQLPASIVLLLVTIVLIIVVSFPWIKLYQMGNKDRLTIVDGISSIVVSMLLLSLLFFTFFKYNSYLRPNNIQSLRDTLSRQITTAFQKEVDTVYHKLAGIDRLVARTPSLFRDVINLGRNNIAFKDGERSAILDSISATLKSVSVTQLFWMNKNGEETNNWICDSMNAPHGNYKARDYFKNIVQGKSFLLHNGDTAPQFYLDQVISWTTGNFTSVLSVPSKIEAGSVAALSFTARSLDQPVLPPGYQFALIDNKGKVLYHSDKTRNLNEDLINEFSERDRLISVLEARTEDYFTTQYFSNEYNINIEPLDGLPYFMVIFNDQGYKSTRDMEIYSFTFSMLVLLFSFFILQLLAVFLVSSKRSPFKKQTYDTGWVGPKVSSHHQYNMAILFNLVMIAFAIAFFHLVTFLTYIFILAYSVTSISIFLNSLFAKRYKASNQQGYYQYKMITIACLFLFILLIDIAAIRILDWGNTALLLGYEIVTILIGFLFFSQGQKILGGIRKYSNQTFLSNWSYTHSFAFMALTRMIITSGIPVVFFYVSSYNYEQNMHARYRQLQYANSLLQKLNDAEVNNIQKSKSYSKGFYYDGAWIKNVSVTKNAKAIKETREDRITAKVLGLFRVGFTDIAVNTDKFYKAQSPDSSFFYNQLLKDASKKDREIITYRQTRMPDQYLALRSAEINYKFPNIVSASSFNGFLFWIFFLLALAGFYFIIFNVLNRLFCITLPDLSAWNMLDDHILANQKINNLLFIIGLPGSGKLARIKQKIENGEILKNGTRLIFDDKEGAGSNVFVADLINIPDVGDEQKRTDEWKKFEEKVFTKRNKLIIVNHFEYNIQDPVTNRIKLNFLERLMLDNQCKIIILSTIHPVAFLDSVMEPSAPSSKQAKEEKTPEKTYPGQELERWHVLLGHYRIVVFALEQTAPPLITDDSLDFIYKETRHTHFLNKMQAAAVESASHLPRQLRKTKDDELILKLQVTSHYFYMYIWQSLTKEEKFLLYDLAEDNLVNSFDNYNLNMLLAKGVVLRQDGALRLFNKGFRNFILTAIGNTEAMKIKNQIKDNGNWGQLKTPLLLVIVAILTFLLASQEEAYSKLITYVATLAAGIPTVLKLFSLFDKNVQKE